jgi:hypothetical protein
VQPQAFTELPPGKPDFADCGFKAVVTPQGLLNGLGAFNMVAGARSRQIPDRSLRGGRMTVAYAVTFEFDSRAPLTHRGTVLGSSGPHSWRGRRESRRKLARRAAVLDEHPDRDQRSAVDHRDPQLEREAVADR